MLTSLPVARQGLIRREKWVFVDKATISFEKFAKHSRTTTSELLIPSETSVLEDEVLEEGKVLEEEEENDK